ncbi:GNAT family N-acetyltransferase [Marivivens marinus]|uniref:GNAT family N-acetyltransferase n=1 Tax=Marivivens marinus TaxID=3110173 RepID=UPI003B845ACB
MGTAWTTPATAKAATIAAGLRAALPRIETERLVLRPCRGEDWDALEPIWTSDRAVHIGGPMTPEEAWLDFAQCVAAWFIQGTGPLAITVKGDDRPLGLVLICAEYGDPTPELGWLLTAEAEGQGYATEAARALRDWGFGVLGHGGFQSFIAEDNAGSIAVAERLGGRPAGTHPLAGDCLVYAYDQKEAAQ